MMTNTMITLLLVALCWSQPVFGVTHNLQYFYTATSGIPNFPEFISAGVVDGQQIDHYDSFTKKAGPKAEWMKASVDSDYWNGVTQAYAGNEPVFKANIELLKSRFNQSGGVHTFQRMYGCQLDDEGGATDGFSQFGYDGEDFVTLDLKSQQYIASTPQSTITKHKWETEPGRFDRKKAYFNQICIDWLRKYLQYGSSTLERKVRPEVTILQKDSGVVCHATGFYPEGVMITWKRDGEEMQEDVDVGETLPNQDETFQKRAVLSVSLEQRKKGKYTCEVAHKSGPPIVVTVEDGNIFGIIIGCVIAALVMVGVIVAIVMMKKKGYKKAEQSDTDSDNSNVART